MAVAQSFSDDSVIRLCTLVLLLASCFNVTQRMAESEMTPSFRQVCRGGGTRGEVCRLQVQLVLRFCRVPLSLI